MVARFYLYREQIVLPTVVQAEAGFYMDAHPVEIYPLKNRVDVKNALERAFAESNELVPTPKESDNGGSALLEALHLKKWSSFEKYAVMYTIYPGGRFTTIYATGRGQDSMWSQEATRMRQFDPAVRTSTLVETIMQDLAIQPEARSERFGLAVIPRSS
jgi:hypothetical protein